MNLSREQCTILKGLAIILIMLHNFVDNLLVINCNEMSFIQENTDIFLNGLTTNKFIWYILSYAGWIGVPVFLFLSGYGLTKKYNSVAQFNTFTYLKNHLVKLLKLLLPVYALYVFFDWFIFHNPNDVKSVLAHATLTINLLHYGREGAFRLEPGVYWFFGAIMQFYILFIFIRKLSIKWLSCLAIVFIIIHYTLLYSASIDFMEWCRHNFIGWGFPFVLGIIAAKSSRDIPAQLILPTCIGSFIVLCVSLVIKPISPLVEPSSIAVLICISNACRYRWVYWVGAISASIYVIHPFIRLLYVNKFATMNYPLAMTIIYVIPVILISWIHHRLLNHSFIRLNKS